jgi:hypothetical protein
LAHRCVYPVHELFHLILPTLPSYRPKFNPTLSFFFCIIAIT